MHLTALQHSEDQKFSAYAIERHAALERKKEEYARQLDAFRKERLGLAKGEGAGNNGGLEGVVRSSSRSSNRGITRGGGGGIAALPLEVGAGMGSAFSTETLGLEHVTLTEGEGGELESFFCDEQEGGHSRTPPVPGCGASGSGGSITPRPRTVPPIISSPAFSQPQAPMSIHSPPRQKKSTPSPLPPPQLPQAQPPLQLQPQLQPPPATAGIIAADEDFDVDSDAVAMLYVSAKGKKGKKKKAKK